MVIATKYNTHWSSSSTSIFTGISDVTWLSKKREEVPESINRLRLQAGIDCYCNDSHLDNYFTFWSTTTGIDNIRNWIDCRLSESVANDTGKDTGQDDAAGKSTFVSTLGAEEAKMRAEMLVHQAIRHLNVFENRAEPLKQLALYVLERRA